MDISSQKKTASHYNIRVETDDGGFTLYNTLTGGITHFEKQEQSVVEAALTENINLDDKIFQALIVQGHLVSNAFDEYRSIEKKRRVGITDKNRLDAIVLTTMSCNFTCPYCYENKRNEFMHADVTKSIGNFLEKRIPDYMLTLLHWFGGEPLLNIEPILEITDRAIAAGKRSGMRVVPQATTNGYLMKGDRLKNLIRVGIKDYQVTLDGHRETHNKLRPLVDGSPTYDQIVENIQSLLSYPDTQLSLRVNFNANNFTNVENLLTEFEPSVRNRVRFIMEPIFGDKEISARGTMLPETIIGFMRQTYKKAAKMGYGTTAAAINLIPEKLVYCYAERENQFIFSPKGDVFKCSVQDFNPEDREGYLKKDGSVIWEKKYGKWMSYGETFAPVCRECAYLPLCMGGCRNHQMRLIDGETCALIATNATRVLQMIDGHGLEEYVKGLK